MKKMSEEQEEMMAHRASIWEAEMSRLNGECTYSTEQVRAMLEEKFKRSKAAGGVFPNCT